MTISEGDMVFSADVGLEGQVLELWDPTFALGVLVLLGKEKSGSRGRSGGESREPDAE